MVRFSGRKVLDLGSNLGEISRYARNRGASMVDGYEYDQHFIDMANLISAYQRVTRVSFHRKDITDPSAYDESYDLVLALSVFVYVEDVLGSIAEKTDALLLETHMLEGNLERYIDPVLEHFPHHHVLGNSEWGTNQDADIRRGVVVFAKTRQKLLAQMEVSQPSGDDNERIPP
jgi:2-polyprenyl-3-methyl-5-hydroxy-6-metoxy-1,4-benzoquinol methylase